MPRHGFSLPQTYIMTQRLRVFLLARMEDSRVLRAMYRPQGICSVSPSIPKTSSDHQLFEEDFNDTHADICAVKCS